MPNAGITGIGSYLPEKVLTNHDLEKLVETSDEWIKTRTGMSERHIAADDQAASDLSLIAARRALESAGLEAAALDAIVLATVCPDYLFPSTACVLQDKLGAVNAGGFDLSAGCAGFASSLAVADGLIKSGQCEHVLVVGVEVLSRVTNWEDRGTCVLFGDGAGAAVVSAVEEEGVLANYLRADGSGGRFLIQPAGGSANPATHETVERKMHYIHMSGGDVFKAAVRAMVEAALNVLEQAGYKPEDLDLLVPHQANIRIIEGVRKRLKVPKERAFVNIERQANTSAATIPICLDEAYRNGRLKRGDLVCTTTFGAGFTWAGNLLRWII
ncbi:MAG: beta-ketoacyl-ACP synthase III [Candidatus Coatesbacteria bacterium]|nr:beta-ketoacyl-ACP synthase III [Candidatus Coatesbacteria bacterium]